MTHRIPSGMKVPPSPPALGSDGNAKRLPGLGQPLTPIAEKCCHNCATREHAKGHDEMQ